MRTSMRTSQSGFALPMVILTVVLLTLGLVAVFTLTGSDRRVADSGSAQVKAFAIAETGLERFFAKRESLSVWVPDSNKWMLGSSLEYPARAESLRINVAGGYADVVLRQVRVGAGNAAHIFAVRSYGVSTVSRLRDTPQAERAVAQYAYWRILPIRVVAGWTAVSGFNKNGTAGTLSGQDACGAMPSVIGVAVGAPGYTGKTEPTSGNPPIQDLGTQQQAYQAAGIDWNAIVNQNALQPDITIPPGSWPSFSNPNYWPVIRVNGDAALPAAGRGILIVTGNLTLSGDVSWDGVLLVGGIIESNGNNTVQGATISGLNVGLGQAVPQQALGNGNKTYQYNSCNIAKAGKRYASLRTYSNAWLDNWSMY